MESNISTELGAATPEIFLSYSHLDRDAAQRFAQALGREGLRVWWDPKLRAGERWDDEVERALRSARVVVVLWSKHSVISHWVRSEAAVAHRMGTIAPVMIEACDRPVMFELVQTADLEHWRGDAADTAWLTFLADVRRLCEHPGIPRDDTLAPALTHSGQTSSVPRRAQIDAREPLANNLPRQLTAILGRSRDIIDIETLLVESHVVTLAGPGGVGKTRLCLEVGHSLVSNEGGEPLPDYIRRHFPGGVWLIDLAALTDPALIAATVATAMNIALAEGVDAGEALLRRLRQEQLLLLMDNCEHLLDAAAAFCEQLLESCSGVKVLATSHEPLRISGETVFHVQPLAVPAGEHATLDAVRESPAVALFVARARAADSRFTLPDSAARTALAICSRLDGLPLAIEMAAARVSSLGMEGLESQLSERFSILTGGRRTALPRQQTLRATLEWSYGLLTSEQQAGFRQIGIFPAAFSSAAAAAVCIDEGAIRSSAAELLNFLVARSLLTLNTTGSEHHFRMLETMREFSRLHLHATEEWPRVAQRHAVFTRARFDAAYLRSFRASDAEMRNAYAADIENLRAALDWAFEAKGDAQLGFALLGSSEPVYLALAQISECRARIEAAIDRIDELGSAQTYARLWDSYGRALGFSNPSKSYECLARAVPVYRETNSLGLAALLTYMGRIAQVTAAQASESERLLDEAAPMVKNLGVPRISGHWYRGMSNRHASHGEFAASVLMMRKSIAAFLEAGALGAASTARTSLGYMLWASGDTVAAIDICEQVIAELRAFQFPNQSALGFALGNLAGMLTTENRIAAAGAALIEAIPLLLEPWQIWVIFDHIALLAVRSGDAASAAKALRFSETAYAEHRTARQPNELRAHSEAAKSVAEKLDAAQFKLSDEEGCKLNRSAAAALAMHIARTANASGFEASA